jgi:uncharacterized MAPEG superfamily protein
MNLALLCVLVAGVLPVVTVGVAKWGPRLDNNNPRDWAQTLEGHRRRAYAAHQNSFEAFPFFAAAVLAAMMTGVPAGRLDLLALVFIAARLAYTALYITDHATPRSIAWIVAWGATVAIYVSAITV